MVRDVLAERVSAPGQSTSNRAGVLQRRAGVLEVFISEYPMSTRRASDVIPKKHAAALPLARPVGKCNQSRNLDRKANSSQHVHDSPHQKLPIPSRCALRKTRREKLEKVATIIHETDWDFHRKLPLPNASAVQRNHGAGWITEGM